MNKIQSPHDVHYLLERRLSLYLLTHKNEILRILPSLFRELFFCRANYDYLMVGVELLKSDIYSQFALESALTSKGIVPLEGYFSDLSNVALWEERHYNHHLSEWLDLSKRRYILNEESKLDPNSEYWFGERATIMETANSIGDTDFSRCTDDVTKDLIAEMTERFKNTGIGAIPTGFKNIDNATGGLLPGTCTVLAARPGDGKTSLACQITNNALKLGNRVLFNSLEMLPTKILSRLTSIHNQIDNAVFTKPWKFELSEIERIQGILEKNKDAFAVHFTRIKSISQLESAILTIRPNLVVFDYLQILPTPSHYQGTRADFLSEMANQIAELSRIYNIPVLLLSQLKRGGEITNGLGDLKGSGGIEESADTVLFLNQDADNGPTAYSLLVKKGRESSKVDQPLEFKGSTTTFFHRINEVPVGVNNRNDHDRD